MAGYVTRYLDSKPSFMGRNSDRDTWGRSQSSNEQKPSIFDTSTAASTLVWERNVGLNSLKQSTV
jgi:hypothetical protein